MKVNKKKGSEKMENVTLFEILEEIQQEFSLSQKEKFKNELIKLILNNEREREVENE